MLKIVGNLGAQYKRNGNTEKHNRREIPGSILGKLNF